jgi:predicted RNA-binding Zn ribbon-like protein
MASQTVDGLRLPLLVAGHPALEICNTLAGWWDAHPNEYLRDHRRLVIWSRLAGFVTPAEADALVVAGEQAPRRAAAAVRRARALRSAWYRILTEARPDPAPLAVLETEVRRAAAVTRLVTGPAGPHWVVDTNGVDSPVLRVAHAARRMMEDGSTAHVGRCPGECCGWVFHDPEGRRRWCIMAICGNREKVRRYRERRRTTVPNRDREEDP